MLLKKINIYKSMLKLLTRQFFCLLEAEQNQCSFFLQNIHLCHIRFWSISINCPFLHAQLRGDVKKRGSFGWNETQSRRPLLYPPSLHPISKCGLTTTFCWENLLLRIPYGKIIVQKFNTYIDSKLYCVFTRFEGFPIELKQKSGFNNLFLINYKS